MTINNVREKCPNCGEKRTGDERIMKKEQKTRHYYCKPCLEKASLLSLLKPKQQFSIDSFKKKIKENSDYGDDYAYMGHKHRHREF